MAIYRRRLRFRLRFGFGLAALVVMLVSVPAVFAAPPKPKPTPASDQYKPTPITSVTLNAARIGKCKLAVIRFYAPKLKRCRTKACRAAVGKARIAAQGRCNRSGMTATQALRPAVKKPVVTTKKPTRKVTAKR